jgi:5-methylcytosine-specific restriction endonuclease McrA
VAWIDDRIWCHPKFTDLSKGAFAGYCKSLAYSSGMGTGGLITQGQMALFMVTRAEMLELVEAGLWDNENDGTGSVRIHDWNEHNGKRDARRASDRERKRKSRAANPGGWESGSKAVQEARREVFERDGGACIDCGEVTDSWHADHVPDRKELAKRGLSPFDIAFIVTRCHPCHSSKTMRDHHASRREAGNS